MLAAYKVHQAAESKEERERRVTRIISQLADALLVNSIYDNFGTLSLSESEHAALSQVCGVFREITSPTDQLNYKLSKEGFVAIVQNLVSNSHENIHGTRVTYSDLMAAIQRVPAEWQAKTFTHEKPASPIKQVSAPQNVSQDNWNDESDGEAPAPEAEREVDEA